MEMELQKLNKKALQLEMKKKYSDAASIHENLENYEKAAYLFRKSNQMEKSAELFIKARKYEKAAEIYLNLNEYGKAAELFIKIEDFSSAAKALVRKGKLEHASKMFEKAGNWLEAAKINVVLRNFMKAGELFEKAGNLIKSAQAYEMMIDQRELTSIDQKKDRDRIAAILMKVKRFEKAAEIYIQSQEITEAILMYIKLNDIAGAVKLYSNCQGDVGHELLENIDYNDKEGLKNILKMFAEAKDFKRAGMIAERMKLHLQSARFYYLSSDFERGAEMFIAAGKLEQAAAMFVKAGDILEAGRLFEKDGNIKRAAVCYESGQDFYKAGILYSDLERYDKAMELLQKIKSNEGHFLEASEVISTIFRKKGMIDLAIQRYEKVIEETEINENTVAFHYRLAMIFVEKRLFKKAKRTLLPIIEFDPSNQEAIELMKKIEALQLQDKETFKEHREVIEEAIEWEEGQIEPQKKDASKIAPQKRSMLISLMEGFEFLKKTSLFEELNLQEMKLIYDLCEKVSFKEGDYIIKEDTPGVAFFIIKRGSVTVRKAHEEGDEILAHLLPGEHFGEMSILDTVNTSANIIAEESVEVFQLDREEFLKMLDTYDMIALKIYRAFLRTLSQRLRISSDKVAYLKSSMDL